uniref:V-SNARE coiled-coil homology domain-containing protein n=1 Tax=Alexandrium monilatum TaxID=311494 RepID=A0A7S4R6S7_9DINO
MAQALGGVPPPSFAAPTPFGRPPRRHCQQLPCWMLIKSALVARGTFVVCEYDASKGNDDLNEISRKVLGKIPRTGAIRSYIYAGYTFNYLLEKDFIFLCIAAVAAGSELVFQFLGEFREGFEKLSRRVAGADRNAEMTRMLRDLIARYNSENGTTKVQRMEMELEEVTDMMRDNISRVMERGERIESLIDKTAALKSESVSFRANAKRYNDDLWWRDQRGRMVLGLIIMAVLVVASWYYWHAWHRKVEGT